MKQQIVAQKILGELVDLGLADERTEEIYWEYIKLAWAAGYDEGRMQRTKRRPIVQMDLKGNPIKIWASCVIAARHFRRDKTALSKAALGKTKSGISAGYRWKYLDENGERQNSSIGTGTQD